MTGDETFYFMEISSNPHFEVSSIFGDVLFFVSEARAGRRQRMQLPRIGDSRIRRVAACRIFLHRSVIIFSVVHEKPGGQKATRVS